MNFRSREELEKAGYAGFIPMRELPLDMAQRAKIPCKRDIYLILRLHSDNPRFLRVNPARVYYKYKNRPERHSYLVEDLVVYPQFYGATVTLF